MKRCLYVRREGTIVLQILLHALLNSTVGGSECSVSRSGRLIPGEVGKGARRTGGYVCRRAGLHSLQGRNISPPRNRTTVSGLSTPQLSHCTDYALPTTVKYHESWMRNQSVDIRLPSYCELLLIGFHRQVVFWEHWPLSSDLFACVGLVELLSKGEEPSMVLSSWDWRGVAQFDWWRRVEWLMREQRMHVLHGSRTSTEWDGTVNTIL
jgi:hypothetical protein